MSRIKSIEPEDAEGEVKAYYEAVESQYGYLPGVTKIFVPSPEVNEAVAEIYEHLHMRPESPLTRVQREMLATVVNGIIGGAP